MYIFLKKVLSFARSFKKIKRNIFKEIKHTKCSYHFIELMKFIHTELESVKNTKDPLEKIAKRMASKHKVIFIDEFQVEDVSDAMIIGKLLNLLSKMNVFIMLTSNAKIENLYKNGLQRDKFNQQIKQLEKDFVVYEFIGDKDYRLKNINLNSERVIPLFIFWYSGNFLYLLNASSHSTSFIGGIAPFINFQSTIESPESVRRVIPPITTIENIRKQPDKSQIITDRLSFIVASNKEKSLHKQ